MVQQLTWCPHRVHQLPRVALKRKIGLPLDMILFSKSDVEGLTYFHVKERFSLRTTDVHTADTCGRGLIHISHTFDRLAGHTNGVSMLIHKQALILKTLSSLMLTYI